MAIQSFKCSDTSAMFRQGTCRADWRAFRNVAVRKLDMLHAAAALGDLRSPPGNRLEKLSGNRADQHSIRINDQWRICFRWGPSGPEDVEIVDYH